MNMNGSQCRVYHLKKRFLLYNMDKARGKGGDERWEWISGNILGRAPKRTNR